jgi:O-antigen/teichoic acid export membrane protein
MGILALLALPAAAGVHAVAPSLVPVVLGAKWLESTALMEILAFNGAVVLFNSSMGAVLMARGHPDRVTKANCVYVVLLFGMLAVFVGRYGLKGAAYAALGTSSVMTPVFLYLMQRRIGVGAEAFARAVGRPAAAAAVMAMIVRWVLPAYERSMPMREVISLLFGGIGLGVG